jgi:hypothetical protein
LVESFRDSLYQKWSETNEKEFLVSKEYGLSVWMDRDNYKQTRTMSKFSVYPDQPEDGSQHHHLTWMESSLTGVKSEH